MTRTIFIAAALALAVTLPTVPTQAAGVGRTFLSAAGSDSNNCANVLTPCRHLATAFAATAQDGEIYVLDPANYGSLTITHGVSIEGHGWASIAPTINNPAITINANPGDKINIIGVVLDGTALTNTTGIQFNSGGSLTVRDSVIRNFGGSGIALIPNGSADFAVSNTLVAHNGVHGIFVQPSGNSVHVNAVFNRVEAYYNAVMGIGIFADLTTGSSDIEGMAVDCVTSHNLDTGYYVLGGSLNVFKVFRSTSLQDTTGVRADTNGFALVSQSCLDDAISWSNTLGVGVVESYGDNVTISNAPDGSILGKF